MNRNSENRRNSWAFRRVAIGAMSALLMAAPLSATGRGSDLGAESPEALFARIQRAIEALDFAELAACMDPDSRRKMIGDLYVGSVMTIAFMAMVPAMGEFVGEATGEIAEAFGAEGASDEIRQSVEASPDMLAMTQQVEAWTARFNEINERHGLPPLSPMGEEDDEEFDQEAFDSLLETIDQPRLIGELTEFLMSMFEEMGDSEDSGEESPGQALAGRVPTGQPTELVVDGDRGTARFDGEAMEIVRIDGRWFAKFEDEVEDGRESDPDFD